MENEKMKLEELGYREVFEKFRVESNLEEFEPARVVAEHKELYMVKTAEGEFEAEITGNLRYNAAGREDFPAVGDWVIVTPYDSGFAVIHRVMPRYSMIKRQAVGQFGEVQVIAANIDVAIIAQAVDRDFNVNRLERYLAICYSSGVTPLILMTKTDLIDETRLKEIKEQIELRIDKVPVIAVSNKTKSGYDELKACLEKGKTYTLLGSSGVGKSTLINVLSGREVMKTGEISGKTNKGKHVTSHRELTIMDNGAILVDNPGMREVGITDSAGGLETTFDMILRFAPDCKFGNCTHTSESGCAVLEAVQKGEIDEETYSNYLKMEKEKTYFESTVSERKKKDKELGKVLKNYKKNFKKK